MTILIRKAGLGRANQFIDDILKSENVQLVSHDIENELKIFRVTGKKMSLTDIALAHDAQARNAILVTFDKELGRFVQGIGGTMHP